MFTPDRSRCRSAAGLSTLLAIAAALVLPTAHAATQGPLLTIDSNAYGDPSSIARSPSGLTVVSWQEMNQKATTTQAVAQAFNADGTPAGAKFNVGKSASAGTMLPTQVAINDAGNITAIYWTKGLTQTSLYAQRYNLSGTAVGTPILVASAKSASQWWRTAMDAAGDFVVAWTTVTTTGSNPCIGVCPPWHKNYSYQSSVTYARSYSAAGKAYGAVTALDTVPQQYFPVAKGTIENADLLESLSMNSTGDFVMLLGVCRQPTDYSILERCDNNSGDHSARALRYHIDLSQAASPQSLVMPAGMSLNMAADASGNVVIELLDYSQPQQYIVSRYDNAGNALGTSAPFGTDSGLGNGQLGGTTSSLAVASNGAFVVTWDVSTSNASGSYARYGQYFNNSVTPTGASFTIDAGVEQVDFPFDFPALDSSGRLMDLWGGPASLMGRVVTLP